jgi:ABC-type multidrug transport system ATPase subunit
MTLLALDRVSKHYGEGAARRTALHEVSLEVEVGELVVVRGLRRSGRSTLLRVAAGVEIPDAGIVRFEGRPLQARGGGLEPQLCYCRKDFPPAGGRYVYDQLLTSQLARGVRCTRAGARVSAALMRVGAPNCAHLRPTELDGAEAMRVALARALTRDPKVIVVDEPTIGTDLLVRDQLMQLLRSLADAGIAILASAADPTGLAGADRALSLGEGELHGNVTPDSATVAPLRLAPDRAEAV